MKKDYTVLLIQLDGKLSSCNLSSIKIILIISLLRELTTPCVHIVDIIIIYTRNELASLAHSFYTCLKHQLIHLTIVLLRSIYTLGSYVWSFIHAILYTVRCGAARPAQLHHQRARTRMCTSLTATTQLSYSFTRKSAEEKTLTVESPPSGKNPRTTSIPEYRSFAVTRPTSGRRT